MYYAAKKRLFIESHTNNKETQKAIQDIFETVGVYEEQIETELREMDGLQVCCALERAATCSVENQWLIASLIRSYLQWECPTFSEDEASEETHSTFSLKKKRSPRKELEFSKLVKFANLDLDKISQGMVSNPQHLQLFLDGFLDPEREETIDNVYRSFLWCGFCGVPEEDVSLLTTDNISFQTMEIRQNEKSYPIYRESLPALSNVVRLQQFRHKHPKYLDAIQRDRISGDLILRGVKSDFSIPTTLRAISKKNAESEAFSQGVPNVSYRRIYRSGLFYRMFQLEQSGLPVDFLPFIKEHAFDDDIQEYKQEESTADPNLNLIRKAKKITVEYKKWKMAFFV